MLSVHLQCKHLALIIRTMRRGTFFFIISALKLVKYSISLCHVAVAIVPVVTTQ